jgi:hypothetical protein
MGVCVERRRSWTTSMPSMSGSPRSSTITSNRTVAATSSACRPVEASRVEYPRAVRQAQIRFRIASSSSTTNTVLWFSPKWSHSVPHLTSGANLIVCNAVSRTDQERRAGRQESVKLPLRPGPESSRLAGDSPHRARSQCSVGERCRLPACGASC